MEMARRIAEFSEKDRVRLRTVVDRSLVEDVHFLWRGARWMARNGQVYVRQIDQRGGPALPGHLSTRVLVSRASGIASFETGRRDGAPA